MERFVVVQNVWTLRRDRLGKRAGRVIEQRQQQTRADTEVARNNLHQFSAAVRAVGYLFAIRFQPAGLALHKGFHIEIDLRRAIDKPTIGKHLVGGTPQGTIINRDFHWQAGRHGSRVIWDDRVCSPNLLYAGIETASQRSERVASLGNVINHFARLVRRTGGQGRENRRRGGELRAWRRLGCWNSLIDGSARAEHDAQKQEKMGKQKVA